MNAERTYHQKVLAILEKLHAEVCNYVPWLWTHLPVMCSVPITILFFLVCQRISFTSFLFIAWLLLELDDTGEAIERIFIAIRENVERCV